MITDYKCLALGLILGIDIAYFSENDSSGSGGSLGCLNIILDLSFKISLNLSLNLSLNVY